MAGTPTKPGTYNPRIVGKVGGHPSGPNPRLLAELVDPLALPRRAIMDCLKSMFSQPYWGPENACKNDFLFIPDQTGDNDPDSPLQIITEQAEEQKAEDGRYYLEFGSGPYSFDRTSIGNKACGGNTLLQPTDRGDYSVMVSSPLRIACKAKKWPTSERLAKQTALFLLFFQPIIRHRTPLHSLGNPRVSVKQLRDSTGSQSQRNQHVVEIDMAQTLFWELRDSDVERINEIVLKGFPPNCTP